MTRRTKLIILVGYLLILTIAMLSYRLNRSKKTAAINKQLAAIAAEKDKNKRDEAELKRLTQTIPQVQDSAGIISALYSFSGKVALSSHDASQEKAGLAGAARGGVKKDDNLMTTVIMKISFTGGFRNISEYIREIQNMERFNRITDIKITPSDEKLKGSLIVEFYSHSAGTK